MPCLPVSVTPGTVRATRSMVYLLVPKGFEVNPAVLLAAVVSICKNLPAIESKESQRVMGRRCWDYTLISPVPSTAVREKRTAPRMFTIPCLYVG